MLTLTGKPKGWKTVAAALDGGKAPSCPGFDKLLAKRLKGPADVKGLAGVLAAKLCGKPAPANAAAILTPLGLGAAPASPAPSATPPPARRAAAVSSRPRRAARRPDPTGRQAARGSAWATTRRPAPTAGR